MKIYHGKIITVDNQNNIYQYLVEDQGKIIYVGDSLPAEYDNGYPTVELGERVLIPAFGDGHLHFSNWALFACLYFDVREAEDIPGIQKLVSDFVSQHPTMKVIAPFGVSKHSVRENRLITCPILYVEHVATKTISCRTLRTVSSFVNTAD